MASPTLKQIEDASNWLSCAAAKGIAACAPPRWNVEQVVFTLLGLYTGPIQHDSAHPAQPVAAQLAAARGHWLRHFHPNQGMEIPSQDYVTALCADLQNTMGALQSSGYVKFAGFGAYGDAVPDAATATLAAMAFWSKPQLASQGGPGLYGVGAAFQNNAWVVQLRNMNGAILQTVVRSDGTIAAHSGPATGVPTSGGHATPIHGSTPMVVTPSTTPVTPTGTELTGGAPPPPSPGGAAPPAGGLSTGLKVGIGGGLLAAAFAAYKLSH